MTDHNPNSDLPASTVQASLFDQEEEFLDETAFAFGVGNEFGWENLECNLAVELQIEGMVHDTPAATA